MPSIRLIQGTALFGQFSLITSLLLWFAVLSPSEIFGPWLALFWSAPLMLALPGLLRGRSYSYAWNSLLLMLYVALGMTELLSNPAEQAYALSVLLCTVVTFIASQLYVRGLGSINREKH